jgi:hypothetical protein
MDNPVAVIKLERFCLNAGGGAGWGRVGWAGVGLGWGDHHPGCCTRCNAGVEWWTGFTTNG